MGKILKDQRIEADKYTLFRILQAWSNSSHDVAGDSASTSTSRHHATATDLIKHIALELIDQDLLASAVRSSRSLVTNEQLLDAYGKQAPLVKQKGVSFKKKRSNTVTEKTKWKSTGGDVLSELVAIFLILLKVES
jgi:hypothetical protein